MVNKAQVAIAKTVLVAGQRIFSRKTVVAAPVQAVLCHKRARHKLEARHRGPNRALDAVGPGLVPVEVDGLRAAHVALKRGQNGSHQHRHGRGHPHAPGVASAHGANPQLAGIRSRAGVSCRVNLDKARRAIDLVLNKKANLRLHGLLAVLLGRCLNCTQHAVLFVPRKDHGGNQAKGGGDKRGRTIPHLTCG